MAKRGALDGFRVIDITSILLGPYATQILGDLGADVIKVEPPPRGDSTRHLGRSNTPGMGGFFLNANRNKRSIALDLKQEAGKGALRRLIESCDVLLHNMRPEAIGRLGFGYEEVARIKPDIIYCGAYGYGEAGPKRGLPAYDDLMQAAAGLSHLFEATTGEPRFAPTVVADKIVGMAAAQAVLAAIVHRERTGEGQAIEVPMYETMVAFIMVEHLYERSFEPPLGDFGYKRLLTPHRRPMKAQDGYVVVLPYTDKQWSAFFELAGLQHLADDPRFASHKTRNEAVHEIYELMADAIAAKPVKEWVARCTEAEIPATAVQDFEDIFNDPHLAEVGLFARMQHESEGEIVMTGHAVNFSKSPGSIRRGAPRYGEHGEELLSEAGLDADEIAQLRASGVLLGPEDMA